MPNKFTKSVMERLEQESLQQKRYPPAKTQAPKQEPAPQEPTPIKEEAKTPAIPAEAEQQAPPVREAPKPKRSAPPRPAPEPAAAPDLSAYLRLDARRLAKNKTFYLDVEVIEAIKAASGQQRVNDSKLVNDILRGVLAQYIPDKKKR